ncbi:MAG: NAD(P)-dependent oxidoreductase [Prolixibacteraceae bacterium]
MKITFIGLGIMGSRMASHLAKNNVHLTVYNRSIKDIEALDLPNVTVANSAQNAVRDADIVFSMLSDPNAIEEVFFGNEGALKSMKENAIWVDSTTVNPSFSIRSFEEAKLSQVRFLDAPVSGSTPQADGAALVFFVGGEDETLKIVEPYINMMGNKIVHVGGIGKGASLKMVVNSMLAQSMVVFSEAVLFGEKMGISRDFLLDLVPNLLVSPPITKLKAEVIRADKYEAQFPLELMYKDVRLANLTAKEENHRLFLAGITEELYAAANENGMGGLDISAIFKYLDQKK